MMGKASLGVRWHEFLSWSYPMSWKIWAKTAFLSLSFSLSKIHPPLNLSTLKFWGPITNHIIAKSFTFLSLRANFQNNLKVRCVLFLTYFIVTAEDTFNGKKVVFNSKIFIKERFFSKHFFPYDPRKQLQVTHLNVHLT